MLAAGLWLAAAGVPLVWHTGVVALFTLPKLVLLAFSVLISTAGAALSYRAGALKLKATPLDASLLGAISFLEHPVIGSGPDTFELGFRRNKSAQYVKASSALEYQAHAHNDILEVLVTTGLLGRFPWRPWSWRRCLRAFSARRKPARDPIAAPERRWLFCLWRRRSRRFLRRTHFWPIVR